MFLARLLLIFLPSLACAAASTQDLQLLRRLGGAWLEQQAILAWPNTQAQAQVDAPDERLRLGACTTPRFFLPAGARLGHAGSVQARCKEPNRWSLYLGYHLRLSGTALVARRDLPARTLLTEGDLELRSIEYEQAPDAYLSAPSLAVGMRTSPRILAGQPLQAAWLSRPPAINAGQRVMILILGEGFRITQEGNALNTAAEGESVRVKTQTGRVVQGIAQANGSVLAQP